MGFTMFARCFFGYHVLGLLLFNDNLLILSHSLILDSSLLISDVMFLVVSSLNESSVLSRVAAHGVPLRVSRRVFDRSSSTHQSRVRVAIRTFAHRRTRCITACVAESVRLLFI